jgi:hypothetical protein
MASLYETVSPCDPLTFKDQNHTERLKEAQQEQVYKMRFKRDRFN